MDGVGEGERLTVRFDVSGEKILQAGTQVLEPYEAGRHGPDSVPPADPAPPTGAREDSIREALEEIAARLGAAPDVKLMSRWEGGKLILRPGKEGLQEKEIPIDDFFHKITMVRDRLRVMEQKINAHGGLSAAEKVELQQYITRIYGSLTTFNILFADRADWFTGQTAKGT